MRFFCCFALLVLAFAISYANNGIITGHVVDKQTDEPLFGANVILINEKLGTATDTSGEFVIEKVSRGNHSVKISYIGYKTHIEEKIVVDPKHPTILNIKLEEDISTTDAVVVTSSYFEIPEDAPVSARTMDYQEIAVQPGGAFDIQRAIQALPAVVSGTDANNEIIVRGGNFGENLFVIDNIEIPNPNHFSFQSFGGGAISTINLNMVEDLDFYAGAFPARFGNKASSVLDIRLKEGKNEAFHLKYDFGIMGVAAKMEGPFIDKNGSFLTSARKDLLPLFMSFSEVTAVPYYWDTQGKFTYSFSPDLKLSSYYLVAEDGISIDSDDLEIYNLDDEFEFEYDAEQYTIGGTLTKTFNNSLLDFTLSSTGHSWIQEYVGDSCVEIFHNYSEEKAHSLKGSYSFFPSNHQELSMGIGIKHVLYDCDFYMKPDTSHYFEDPTENVYGFDIEKITTINNMNSFLHYRHSFGAMLTTNIGGRIDYIDYNNNCTFSPRLSLAYKLTDKATLSVACGRHYQPPDWYQLTFNGTANKLDSYYTDHYIMGISHLFFEDIMGSIEIYHKRYQDVPVDVASITENPLDMAFEYVNYVEGFSNGIEFFLQKKVKENFWGTLSYTYADAKNLDPRKDSWEGHGENPYDYYSKSYDYGHVFTGILGYRAEYEKQEWYNSLKQKTWYKILRFLTIIPSDVTDYSIKYRYLGGRPYSEQTYNPGYGRWYIDSETPYNQLRTPSYSRLDIRIQSQFYSSNAKISTYIEIDNILNTKNVYGYSYNSNGTVETIYQLPLVPMVGIIVEF